MRLPIEVIKVMWIVFRQSDVMGIDEGGTKIIKISKAAKAAFVNTLLTDVDGCGVYAKQL